MQGTAQAIVCPVYADALPPIALKPMSIMAQVAGSGTASTVLPVNLHAEASRIATDLSDFRVSNLKAFKPVTSVFSKLI